jgi:hypothetical protein
VVGLADLDSDGRPDVVWRRPTDGANAVWLMNGVTATSVAALPSPADPAWRLVAVADLNGDRKADLVFRHQTSGANAAVFMSQLQAVGSAALPTVADASWRLVGPR